MLTSFVVTFLAAIVLAFLYLLPTLVAVHRKHHQRFAILVLNVLLGFTGICWVVALIWSASAVEPSTRK